MAIVIAHRAWGLVNREGHWLLQPVANRQQTWLGPAVTADERPSMYNSTGIYAYRERILVEFDFPELPVVGAIQLYGHVVEHKFGYRAEKAIIRSLDLRCELSRLADTSGIPDGPTYVRFNAIHERIKLEQVRGRDRLTRTVGRFMPYSVPGTMSMVADAKAALEKRYQVDVNVLIEEA